MDNIVNIENLDHLGRGIGKINGKVVFVPKTYIGDKVEVDIMKNTKKYMEGKVIKYLENSKDKIEFKCPYYNECGGCNIAHINYQKQLEFKTNMVKNIFKKYAKIEINPEIHESENKLNYRNKVVLHIQNNKLGYYKDNTNKLIEINKCLLLEEKLNNALKGLGKKLDIDNLKEIVLRTNGKETLVRFNSDNPLFNIETVLKDQNNIEQEEASKILNKNAIVFNLDKYKYAVTAESFFQVNTKQAINLYNKVREYMGKNKINLAFDLYCGTGTIAIYISDLCNKVVGIEINEDAIECANCANYNKKLNNIDNIEFINGNVSNIINSDMKPDIIVVDPPRNGLDNKTISIIKNINPKKIIYVSCNPITLARDINRLSDKYKFSDMELFDMFPNTYHVESVILLQRKD